MAEHFASGNWHVKKGKEKEFVERWTEFLQWSRKTQPALVTASLIGDESESSHFVSLAEWEDARTRAAWRQSPEFTKLFGACRDLCDDFYGSDYHRTVTI